MRFTVSISAQAGQDLEEIVFFITAREQDSRPAERFAHSLLEEAGKLAEFPTAERSSNGDLMFGD